MEINFILLVEQCSIKYLETGKELTGQTIINKDTGETEVSYRVYSGAHTKYFKGDELEKAIKYCHEPFKIPTGDGKQTLFDGLPV